MTNRLGPDRLPPGQAPDGIVVHVYRPDGECILERTLTPADAKEKIAALADADSVRRATPEGGSVIIVFYDGDTGERHPEWMPFSPGTRLEF